MRSGVDRRRGFLWRLGGGALIVLLIGVATGWAIVTIFAPARDVLPDASFTTVRVKSGEVGSSLSLNATANWTSIPVGVNQATGTVTTAPTPPGELVNPGDVLYTVNLRPVVVAQGELPAFRTLTVGTKGADVAQLQTLLRSLAFYRGSSDGSFAVGTERAVRAWQKSLLLEQTGVVEVADIIFVPDLPTRITYDAAIISRGATLAGGDAVISGLPSAPAFTIPVDASQSALIPDGTRVEITGPNDQKWTAYAKGRDTEIDTGTVSIQLASTDNKPICVDDCDSLSVTGQSLLPSQIITLETVSGLVVPSAALITSAAGEIHVVDEAGKRHQVTVEASAKGMSVVTGIDASLTLRIPGKATVNQ